jgi:hypothetical protein
MCAANPFRVERHMVHLFPGLSLRSNPGLKLANAFGVKNYPDELKLLAVSAAAVIGCDFGLAPLGALP